MYLKLQGRRILVTGASGGIGSCIARVLAGGGAHFGLHYNSSATEAEELSAEPALMPRGSTLVQADLTSQQDSDQMFERLAENGGVQDLVCNAGYMASDAVHRPCGPGKDMHLERFQRRHQ